MSARRAVLIAVAGVVLALSLLYVWAAERCTARGEVLLVYPWSCVPSGPPPVILQRDLHRT